MVAKNESSTGEDVMTRLDQVLRKRRGTRSGLSDVCRFMRGIEHVVIQHTGHAQVSDLKQGLRDSREREESHWDQEVRPLERR
jgi:hypothetical protein